MRMILILLVLCSTLQAQIPRHGFYTGNAESYSYQTETLTLVNRFTTPPSTALKQLIDSTFILLKGYGILSKLDVFYVMNVHDGQAALQNWVENDHNGTLSGTAPTFTQKDGFSGNGSSSYITTDYIPSSDGNNFGLNSASVTITIVENPGTTARNPFGTIGSTSNYSFYQIFYTAGDERFYLNNGTYIPKAMTLDNIYTITRTGANLAAYENGGTKTTASSAVVGVSDQEMTLLAMNNNGSMTGYFSGRIQMWAIGGFLSDDEVANLYTCVKFFNDRVNATF